MWRQQSATHCCTNYRIRDMGYGFTTGSCAAAAAKAAAYMLLGGREKKQIQIDTPKGIPYLAQLLQIQRTEHMVSCAVQKDAGDDPDITNGMLIFAAVSYAEEALSKDRKDAGIIIEGGVGVGRVTRPGLDQPVGAAAINHVPREMIEKEVREVCGLFDFSGTLRVVISIPEGEKIAEQTFNPRLGIVGGLSILGTSGIVEPMSSQALLDTIRIELRQKRAEGQSIAFVSPGNYGVDYMRKTYGLDLNQSVKCSNFVGAAIDFAAEEGFSEMLLTGHIGKLIKLSGGIMNTHSREADCRMELLAAAALYCGVEPKETRKILDCVTTDEAIRILQATGSLEAVMARVLEQIQFYLRKRAAGRLNIECIVFSNEFGELGISGGASTLIQKLQEEDRDLK